jgi:hypothetical protein
MAQTRLRRSQLHRAINNITGTDYTLQQRDANAIVRMTSALDNQVTVPPASSVAYRPGTAIEIVQWGTGQTTLVPGAGVTIHSPAGLVLGGQGASVLLVYVGSDVWEVWLMGTPGVADPFALVVFEDDLQLETEDGDELRLEA